MPPWGWILVALAAGIVLGVIFWTISLPRLSAILSQTPSPELPEDLAPGWHAQCNKCGRTRTLASVGGIRLCGNRDATKATVGWCRACGGLRMIRIVHTDHLHESQTG